MTRPAAAPRLGVPGLRRRPARSSDVASDAAQFESVYRDCAPELYRYARSIVRDEHAAEDVLQSTMEKALSALRAEPRDFELRPWLFRIAHNEAVSRLRREKPAEALPDTVVSVAAPVADQLDDKQTLEQLWVDLATLPERQRQALVLRELSGLGHEEIGAVLETSGRAVKQTIFEARRALLDCSEGRAMACDEIQQQLSDGDGRVRRSRRIQSHLRSCRDCRAFDAAIHERPEQLRALVPVLPAAAAASVLATLLPGGTSGLASSGIAVGHAGGSAAGAWSIGSLGGTLATKATVIAVASVAAVGGTGVAVVKQQQATQAPSAAPIGKPAGAATPNAAGSAASPGGSGANGAGGSSATAGASDDEREKERSTDGKSANDPNGDPGSSAAPGARDSAQGEAGKARAAVNKAAAAKRRAAAQEKRATAKAKAKAKAKTKTTAKTKTSTSGSSANGRGGGQSGGNSSKAPKANTPTPKSPAAPDPAPTPVPAPAPAERPESQGSSGNQPATGQPGKAQPPGRSG